MKWFVKCIRNYVNFTGRASRVEFWSFIFSVFLLTLLAYGADYAIIGTDFREKPIFAPIVALFLFLPQLAVMVRRLHDTGHCGWWAVCWWITSALMRGLEWYAATCEDPSCGMTRFANNAELPLVGVLGVYGLILLFWLVKSGDKGDNKYGPEPKTYGKE